MIDMYLAFQPRNCFQGLPPIKDAVCIKWVQDMLRTGVNVTAVSRVAEKETGPSIVGHTAQKNCQILDLGYLKCIDTWCYGDGWLTALEPETGQVWQVDKNGRRKDEG